jgi:hypothetical protein
MVSQTAVGAGQSEFDTQETPPPLLFDDDASTHLPSTQSLALLQSVSLVQAIESSLDEHPAASSSESAPAPRRSESGQKIRRTEVEG